MIKELIPSKFEDDYDLMMRELPALYNNPETLPYISFTFKDFKKETFEAYLKHHGTNGVKYFADLQKGKIAGLATLAENSVSGIELLLLLVRPEFRGAGTAKKLMERAFEYAMDESYRAMRIAVYCDNFRMLGLTAKYEFKPYAIEYHKRDDGEDILWLKKYFKESK